MYRSLCISQALACALSQSQFEGDSLQLYWCSATDPLQQFTLSADGTVRSSSGFCIANMQNTTLALAKCNPSDASQLWSYGGSMFSQGNTCWNLQSGQDYMYPNASVKVYSCNPPNWNDYFTVNGGGPGTVLANYTNANNATLSGLCVQSLHTIPPVPTADALAWQENPVACFVHFNMATAAGTQGCGGGAPPPITTWAPTALDTDQWVNTCKSMGGTRMVYTAKHGCGFLAWHSNVSALGYNYSVASSLYPEVDVVARVVASARKAGLGIGFYYSVVSNAYANVQSGTVQPGPIDPSRQLNLTQEQYDMLVVAHLTELYTAYGPLAEVWFDGGYQPQLQPALQAIFAELQPHVVAFGGLGLVASPARWVGTEDGYAPYPCWSTAGPNDGGAGSPDGPYWLPAETDFTLQNGDNWFYSPTAGVHSPSELRAMWETSVGSNTAVIIDIAPHANGTVPAEQVQAAALLGQYTSTCYGGPSNVGFAGPITGLTLTAPIPGGGERVTVDRVMIQEDQTQGQRVRGYTLTALYANGSSTVLGSGSSIGARRIHVFSAPTNPTSITLTITAHTGGSDTLPTIAGLTALSCDGAIQVWEQSWAQWVQESGYGAALREAQEREGGQQQEAQQRTSARAAQAPWRVARGAGE